MNPPLNQVNHAGCASASAPPAKTQIGNRFVAMERMRFTAAFYNDGQTELTEQKRAGGCQFILKILFFPFAKI
jgi:hypothetical protein